jgi:hypothetical protein
MKWLREIEELEEILRHLPKMIVCTFNTELVYERAYGTLFFELGLPAENVIGKKVSDVVELHRRGIVLPYFHAALQGHEVTFLHERNNLFLEVNLFPIRRMSTKGVGEVVGGISTTRDVSHRIRNIMMHGMNDSDSDEL